MATALQSIDLTPDTDVSSLLLSGDCYSTGKLSGILGSITTAYLPLSGGEITGQLVVDGKTTLNDTTNANDIYAQSICVLTALTVGSRTPGSTIGKNSVAEGSYTEASSENSHAEGLSCIASGSWSHVEGRQTSASYRAGHAEGYITRASGEASHAEGWNTTAAGNYSHAEGGGSTANADFSHAEGSNSRAYSSYSHAEGLWTIAQNTCEHAQGQYNNSVSASTSFGNGGNTHFSIGIGTAPFNRKNAVEVMQDGKMFVYGLGGYDGTNSTSTEVKDLAALLPKLTTLSEAEWKTISADADPETIYFIAED